MENIAELIADAKLVKSYEVYLKNKIRLRGRLSV